MIPSFGKQTVTIGSHPQCDVVLQSANVAAEHGRLVNQGGGKLVGVIVSLLTGLARPVSGR